MKIIKMLIPSIAAFTITSIIYNNFFSFCLNIGAIWINIKYFQILLLGFFLTFLLFFSNVKSLLLSYKIILLLLVSFFILKSIDSVSNLKSLSILLFLIIEFTLTILAKSSFDKSSVK